MSFGAEHEVASFDVVPAFKRKGSGGGWEIPDVEGSDWISTNPQRHYEQSTFASLCFFAGRDLRWVMGQLGHDDPRMTWVCTRNA